MGEHLSTLLPQILPLLPLLLAMLLPQLLLLPLLSPMPLLPLLPLPQLLPTLLPQLLPTLLPLLPLSGTPFTSPLFLSTRSVSRWRQPLLSDRWEPRSTTRCSTSPRPPSTPRPPRLSPPTSSTTLPKSEASSPLPLSELPSPWLLLLSPLLLEASSLPKPEHTDHFIMVLETRKNFEFENFQKFS